MSSPIRIAVLNRGRDAHPGGDLVHIDNLSAALAKIGVERTYINHPEWTTQEMRQYDVLHVQHCNFTWSRQNFHGACESGVPWVVTCCFYPTEKLGIGFAEMTNYLLMANEVIVYSEREVAEMESNLVTIPAAYIIPPGVGPEFHAPDVTAGDGREGVITVAARGGDKNTDKVEAACAKLGIPYRNVTGVSREDLPAEYRKARVYVNAADMETFGLSILEALASGCRTIISPGCWSREWLNGICVCDPTKPDWLYRAIGEAYSQWWDYQPNAIARALTWDLEAQRVKAVYERVLG